MIWLKLYEKGFVSFLKKNCSSFFEGEILCNSNTTSSIEDSIECFFCYYVCQAQLESFDIVALRLVPEISTNVWYMPTRFQNVQFD
jgi:hypothetical protein